MSAFLRSPSHSKRTASAADDAANPHRRVILLLDMDCFYAQCEVVRLGLDRSIPLALMQWNSALAVNYPARAFGIKRGDSFEAIREKSGGKCVCIHLPVTPVEETPAPPEAPSPSKEGDGGGDCEGKSTTSSLSPRHGEQPSSLPDDSEVESSQKAYDDEFNQPKDVREEMYRVEKNTMRSPTEGKACLDRYRLASSRIFSLIDEVLAEKLGRKHFILERASIDELFIDVTASCSRKRSNEAEGKTTTTEMQFRSECVTDAMPSLKETVICHESLVHSGAKNDEIGEALRCGCHIALTVRRAVFQNLGFTLSAGISTSKLVSKLAASYGKPNGQALIYPGDAMATVMEETPIRKTRLLGGKLGKKVQSLLPDTETTLGSISRLLPLDSLERAIGEESGKWVFDACRGIDFEEVRPTLKVLPKSITAFKSFPKVSYPELEKWTALLARDVMKRVDTDSARNNRIPKAVTVGYTMVPGGAWIGQSFRLPFPADKDFNSRVKKLVDNTRRVLTERGHSYFIRIGYSAIDFVHRPKKGIDSFFGKGKIQPSSSSKRLIGGDNHAKKGAHAKLGVIDSFFSTRKNNAANTKPLQFFDQGDSSLRGELSPQISNQKKDGAVTLQQKAEGTDMNNRTPDSSTVAKTNSSVALGPAVNFTDEEIARQLQDSYNNEAREESEHNIASSDRDKALACQLQSSYDREHAVLTHMERFTLKKKKNSNTNSPPRKSSKRSRIDYFLKK